MFATFGQLCGDPQAAAKYRREQIDPNLGQAEAVVFNCEGVRVMNSSFAKVLISNLISLDPDGVLKKLKFENCQPAVNVQIVMATKLAFRRFQSELAPL